MKKSFLIGFLFSGMLSASNEIPALQGNESLAGGDVVAGALVPQPVPSIPAEDIVQPRQSGGNEKSALDDVESNDPLPNPLDSLCDGLRSISYLGDYCVRASEKINALSEELEKVKNENRKVLQNFDTYVSQFSMVKSAYLRLMEQKGRFRESYEKRLAEKEKKREEEIESLKREHAENVRKYENDITVRYNSLKAEVSAAYTSARKANDLYTDACDDMKKLEDKVKELESKIEGYKKDISNKESEIQSLKARIAEIEKKRELDIAEQEMVKNLHGELKKQVKSFYESVGKLLQI